MVSPSSYSFAKSYNPFADGGPLSDAYAWPQNSNEENTSPPSHIQVTQGAIETSSPPQTLADLNRRIIDPVREAWVTNSQPVIPLQETQSRVSRPTPIPAEMVVQNTSIPSVPGQGASHHVVPHLSAEPAQVPPVVNVTNELQFEFF